MRSPNHASAVTPTKASAVRNQGRGVPTPVDQNSVWFVIFGYNEAGYVRDDEKDKIDADSLLKSITEATDAANKIRQQHGWATIKVVGWHTKPFYSSQTNRLSWAILGRSSTEDTINYNTRLLGRRGVMSATLVI